MNQNQYVVLEDAGEGRLIWRVIKPIPIGTALDSVPMLEALIRQQVMAPMLQQPADNEQGRIFEKVPAIDVYGNIEND